jgi:hypothetical protein
MPSLLLESHGCGYILSTARKYACGLDRSHSEWEPAKPISIFVQSDWDFPGLASLLGFQACSECRYTDGTVDCEHNTASDMIQAAANFLHEHTGILSGKKYAYACETVIESGTWG